ncbi:MAG: head GIN domain-containing protein [Gillisia sp.]
MKKLFLIVFIAVLATGCAPNQLSGCLKGTGDIVQEEVDVAPFHEIIVYERVKLFIQQGPEQKVVIETGKNLRKDVYVDVKDGRLSIHNDNSCNLFRDYEVTKVYVTLPDLTWLQNSSGYAIESIGVLKFDNLWLRSFNQEMDPKIHTDGDFKLNLNVHDLRITNDNYSNYFLSGKADHVNAFFASGDGRLEGRNFIVQKYDIFHRGTNKLIVNPQQSFNAELRSTGDVIVVHRPPQVQYKEYYTGRVIFEAPAP